MDVVQTGLHVVSEDAMLEVLRKRGAGDQLSNNSSVVLQRESLGFALK